MKIEEVQRHTSHTEKKMGQCLSLQNHKYKCLFSDSKKDKRVEKTENVIRPIELKLKHKTTDKKISKPQPKSEKTVWDDWQRSEASNRHSIYIIGQYNYNTG